MENETINPYDRDDTSEFGLWEAFEEAHGWPSEKVSEDCLHRCRLDV